MKWNITISFRIFKTLRDLIKACEQCQLIYFSTNMSFLRIRFIRYKNITTNESYNSEKQKIKNIFDKKEMSEKIWSEEGRKEKKTRYKKG